MYRKETPGTPTDIDVDIVSGHLHTVVGASTFNPTFDNNVWSKANCSSIVVQENKSNYWMPSLMAQHANRSFSSIPVFETRIYYLNNVRFPFHRHRTTRQLILA